MRRLVMQVRFQDQATPPVSNPPSFSVRGESVEITQLDGESTDLPKRAAYETRVRFTGETTFVEDGTMTFDSDADHLRIVTAGTLGPSAEPGVQHGSVIWRIEEGEGRFAAASGLITSNFTVLADRGEVAWTPSALTAQAACFCRRNGSSQV